MRAMYLLALEAEQPPGRQLAVSFVVVVQDAHPSFAFSSSLVLSALLALLARPLSLAL